MSITDDLMNLDLLRQRGSISDAEFAMAKRKLLAEVRDTSPVVVDAPGIGLAGAASPDGATTRWPPAAKLWVGILVVVVLLLAAPIAYKAFEKWVFRNTHWNFPWE